MKFALLKKLFKTKSDPMDMEALRERRAAHDAIIVVRRQSGIETGFLQRKDGTQERFLAGELHDDDGPAIIKADGTKMWFRNGKLHRDGGPAIEGPDGRADYWQNGEPVHAPPPVKAAEAAKQQADIPLEIDRGIEQPITVSRPISLRKQSPDI